MAAKIATEKLCFPHFCPVRALSAHIKVRVKIRSGDRRSSDCRQSLSELAPSGTR